MRTIRIAGLALQVQSAVAFSRFNDAAFYRDFLAGRVRLPDCSLTHRIALPPALKPSGPVFSTQNWQLFPAGERMVLCVGPAPKRGRPDNCVVFEKGYARGTIYQKSVFELFRRFIDQFILMNLLAGQGGFLLHASGIVYKRRGICFTGPSGAGKSTMLDLFKGREAVSALLNDDRVALRPVRGRWKVFGTPWYGESRVSSCGSAPLSAVFFIRHAPVNTLRRLNARDVCSRMPVLGLVPLWDERATQQVLAAFDDLLQRVPLYDLGFVPDARVLDLIDTVL